MKSASRRRRWIVAAGLPLTALALLFGLALRTPGWYADAAGSVRDPQAVREDVRVSAQNFSDALLGSEPFTVHLRESQVNAWVALRGEIYPALEGALPPKWGVPMVRFADGCIRVAAVYRGGPAELVVSIDLRVAIEADDLVLQAVALRCGGMRLPVGVADTALSRAIDLPAGKAWRGSPAMLGALRGGLRIGRRAVWPNGDRAYEVEAISAASGRLNLLIRPLGPAHRGRRSQEPDTSGFFTIE